MLAAQHHAPAVAWGAGLPLPTGVQLQPQGGGGQAARLLYQGGPWDNRSSRLWTHGYRPLQPLSGRQHLQGRAGDPGTET